MRPCGDEQALFARAQDGIVYPNFEAMGAKNHVSYDYFVTSPKDLLEKHALKWRKRLEMKRVG